MGFLSAIGDAFTSTPALVGLATGGAGGAITGATPSLLNSSWNSINGGGGNDGTAGGYQFGTPPPLPTYTPGSYQAAQYTQGPGYSAPTSTQAGATPIDQRGIDAFRSEALGDTSPWTTLQMQQAKMGAQDQSNALAQQNGAQSQQAQDQIAMGGGLTSGASERAATDSARNNLFGQQNIARNLAENQQGIQIAGRNQQLQALSQLPGMDLQAASLGQNLNEFNTNAAMQAANNQNQFGLQQAKDLNNFNLGNTQQLNQYSSNNAAQQNAFNQGIYGQQSSIYGAQQLANQSAYDRNNRSLWDKVTGA